MKATSLHGSAIPDAQDERLVLTGDWTLPHDTELHAQMLLLGNRCQGHNSNGLLSGQGKQTLESARNAMASLSTG